MTLEYPRLMMMIGCLLLPLSAAAQSDGDTEQAEGADETAAPAEGAPDGEAPADDDSADAEPADADATDEEPTGDEPTDGEPADGEPADGEPADATEDGEEDGGDLEWDDIDMPSMGEGDIDDWDGSEADGPDAGQATGDGDDIDDWDGEIEKQDLNQIIEREEVRVEVEAEPERIGISGNWFHVEVECTYCDTVLGQNLEVQDALIMRQFFDHLQIDPSQDAGKMVYPSEGNNRPFAIQRDGDRVIVYMYGIDEGERTTPLYCTVWDLHWLLRDKKLLYGRRYTVDAYQLFAFGTWEKGWKADETFLPVEQLRTFLDLDLVRRLDEDDSRFPVGEKAVLNYLGGIAFVRSDFETEPFEDLQNRLFKEKVQAEERSQERVESLDRGIEAFDDRDYEAAAALLLRAGELGEDSLDYHFYLGGSYQGAKRYEEAMDQYRIVLALDPMDTVTRYNLGRILEKLGRYKESLHEYQVILKHDPDDDEVKDRMLNLMLELQMGG